MRMHTCRQSIYCTHPVPITGTSAVVAEDHELLRDCNRRLLHLPRTVGTPAPPTHGILGPNLFIKEVPAQVQPDARMSTHRCPAEPV
jgi:hypothetical protein